MPEDAGAWGRLGAALAEDHVFEPGSRARDRPPTAHADRLEVLLDVMTFVGRSDLEPSGRFYAEVLGLECIESSSFANVHRGGNALVRVAHVAEPVSAPYAVLGFDVADIEATVPFLESAGSSSPSMTASTRTGMESGRRRAARASRGSPIRTATFSPSRSIQARSATDGRRAGGAHQSPTAETGIAEVTVCGPILGVHTKSRRSRPSCLLLRQSPFM